MKSNQPIRSGQSAQSNQFCSYKPLPYCQCIFDMEIKLGSVFLWVFVNSKVNSKIHSFRGNREKLWIREFEFQNKHWFCQNDRAKMIYFNLLLYRSASPLSSHTHKQTNGVVDIEGCVSFTITGIIKCSTEKRVMRSLRRSFILQNFVLVQVVSQTLQGVLGIGKGVENLLVGCRWLYGSRWLGQCLTPRYREIPVVYLKFYRKFNV
jgi:hypothetical protein